MARFKETIWCDQCGVDIYWAPTVEGQRDYCCPDCRDGLRCDCGDRYEIDEYRREQVLTVYENPAIAHYLA